MDFKAFAIDNARAEFKPTRSLLAIAEDNAKLWRKAWSDAMAMEDRGTARVAAEELEFWTNKAAFLASESR